MKRTILSAILTIALAFVASAQVPERSLHQGETFELNSTLPNGEVNTYTASNYIKLLSGFNAKPNDNLSTLLNLGLDEFELYPPENGMVNEEGNVVGTLGGTVNIGAMGGLNYSIPIELPSGINGMQPSIAINYNNQGGNGLLGWGWDLHANSCITRAGQTIYHDGRMTSADLSVNDRFLLDGQRLILINGNYGLIGSEYKTENDCMSRIRFLQDNNENDNTNDRSGTYFKVWDRTGNILEYRDKLLSPDGTKVIMWMLSNITDRYGNSIQYHYNTNNETGEIQLGDIEYTINENQNEQAQFRVQFFYKSYREDYERYFIGGCQLYHRDLLLNIKVINLDSGLPVCIYHFNYIEELSGNQNRLYHILSSIDKKIYDEDGNYEKYNSTTITWDDTPPSAAELYPILNSSILEDFPFTGDFNGDGYTDLAMVPYKREGQDHYTDPVDIKIFLNNRNCGFTHASFFDITSLDKTLDWVYILDIDGDGLDDIAPYFYDSIQKENGDSTVVRVYHNNRNSFSQVGQKYVNGKAIVITGDFDGNSTQDIILLEKKDQRILDWNWWNLFHPYDIRWITYLQNIYWMGYQNTAFNIRQLNGSPLNKTLGPVYDAVAFDYNGDGISETLLVGLDEEELDDYGSKLIRFNFGDSNTGVNIIETYTSGTYPHYVLDTRWCHIFPGDYNGDGKTDLLYSLYDTWKISFSEGDRMGYSSSISDANNSFLGLPSINHYRSIFPPSLSLMNNVPSSCKMMFSAADFDGDGCTDICYSRENYNNKMIIASRIETPSNRNLEFRKKKALDINFNFRSQFTHVGNFMGQDNASFLESLQPSENDRSESSAYIISPASVNQYNSVATITDGMGNRTSFTYECLMPSPTTDDDPFYLFSFNYPDQYGVRPTPIAARALRTCTKEGINGSSNITKYSYENAYCHKYGHGFMGFEYTVSDFYRNSIETGWKTRETTWNDYTVMGSYAMMLPRSELYYTIENNQPQRISETGFQFTNVTSSNSNSNLVVCPALLTKTTNDFSMDDYHQIIKTTTTSYEYDYAYDYTYTDTYGCTNTTETVTGYENGQGFRELETQKSFERTTYPNAWILNRPDSETVTLTRNGETKSVHTEFGYLSNDSYEPNQVKLVPNDGSISNDPLTTVTHYGFDSFGNATDVIIEAPYGIQNEQQREAHYRYGNGYHHRLLTREYKGAENEGYLINYAYDFQDRLCSTTDCNGKTIRMESSPAGVLKKTFPFDGTEQRTLTLWADDSPYKPEGASYFVWSKKTGGITTMTFYHKTGLELRQVTFAFDGTPIFVDKKYDEEGLLEKESAPYRQGEPEENLKWTSYTYDSKERPLGIQYPDGAEKTMEYHGLRTNITVTPYMGSPQTTSTILNALGWPKENTDAVETANPTSVHYEYYPDGNLKWTRIGDDAATTIRLQYDHAGNRILLHDPNYCTETADLTSVYNAFGEEVSTTTPKGLTTTYLYDQFGRMTQRSEEEPTSGGGTETKTTIWDYYQDATELHKGLLHSISYPGQMITYTYDLFQRVKKEVVSFSVDESYTTSYTYDPASRKSGVQYPSGFKVNYLYNRIGYLKEITDHKGNSLYCTEKTNPFGQIERFKLGNSMVSRREYHPEKHTLERILTTKGENILQDLSYDYDGFINLAARTDNTRNLEEHFTYDHLNRLTGIRLGNTATGWMDYDGYGRMMRKVADNIPIFASAVYGITSKPHALDAAKTWQGIFPNDDQIITYTSFDKVKTIAEGNNTLQYTYGYDRQRIFMEEHASGTERTKRYVGDCEFQTRTENNATTERTLTCLNSPIGIFAVVERQDNEESVHYILKDHLGSWTTITDHQGNIEQELSFDAWGNLRSAETWRAWGQLPEPMFDRGFTGHEHLYAFGLINMNGRMYDPQMSSFLSVDAYVQSPENSQSFNRYTYCMNNPLKYVDPSGWVMVGGMTPGNPFHENWSVNYGVPVHGSSDFNNAYYKLNMALYGNMDGLCGGGPYESGGMGILSSYQAAMKYYQSASPNMVWSFSHLINNYVNDPSVFNRRELLDAGVTDYTYKTWWTAEGQGGYQYTISFNQGSFSYGNDNYNFGYKGYLDATIWAMDLSVKGTKSTDLNKAIILAQSFGVGNGAKTEIIDYAVRSNYKTARTWNEFRNLRPTQKAWRQVNTLGMTGTKYLKASKLAGKACVLLSTGVEVSQLYNYYESGGLDANVYAKSTLDIAMGVVGLCGPIGFGISLTYFVIDLTTDGFNGWGKMP